MALAQIPEQNCLGAVVSGTDDRRQARIAQAMIVALARKLLIALWRYVTIGKVPAGAVLRSAT
jgi:hypothetical protein